MDEPACQAFGNLRTEPFRLPLRVQARKGKTGDKKTVHGFACRQAGGWQEYQQDKPQRHEAERCYQHFSSLPW
ncbi:MAG: hypothetical protein K6C33_00350 [Desulfovibrio sp.]|nr:hypothetical protein [Desulfovibrio sp.]